MFECSKPRRLSAEITRAYQSPGAVQRDLSCDVGSATVSGEDDVRVAGRSGEPRRVDVARLTRLRMSRRARYQGTKCDRGDRQNGASSHDG